MIEKAGIDLKNSESILAKNLSDLAYYREIATIRIFDKFYNEGFMEEKFDIKDDYMFKDYLLTLIYFRKDIAEQFSI